MLIAAEKSLKALNRNDITEVKAMKRPPVGVLLVIETICIINNVKPIKVCIGDDSIIVCNVIIKFIEIELSLYRSYLNHFLSISS